MNNEIFSVFIQNQGRKKDFHFFLLFLLSFCFLLSFFNTAEQAEPFLL
jgi:hypothetical protein